jgi:hypothetical protein
MDNYLTFKDKSVIKSEYLNDNIYDLLDKTFEIPNNFMFNVIKVEPQYVARPDLLSYDLYGTDIYVDIICKLNDISNPFEMNEGQLIVVPNSSYLTNFYVTPLIKEQDGSADKPKPKAKQNKRKPNEAIIGDKNFTIDTKKRIIIY